MSWTPGQYICHSVYFTALLALKRPFPPPLPQDANIGAHDAILCPSGGLSLKALNKGWRPWPKIRPLQAKMMPFRIQMLPINQSSPFLEVLDPPVQASALCTVVHAIERPETNADVLQRSALLIGWLLMGLCSH